MNLQSLVNGSNLCWILSFVTENENTHLFFQWKREGFRYCAFWDTIKSIEGMDSLQKKKGRIYFRQGINKNEISDFRWKYKKKTFSTPPNKQRGNIFIYFVSFWRHGRAVRWGTANPFSPVQIWVSPDHQKTRLEIPYFPWPVQFSESFPAKHP